MSELLTRVPRPLKDHDPRIEQPSIQGNTSTFFKLQDVVKDREDSRKRTWPLMSPWVIARVRK